MASSGLCSGLSSLAERIVNRTLERVIDIGAISAGYYWFVHRPNTLEEAKATEDRHSKQQIMSNHLELLQNTLPELKKNEEN